MFQVTQNLWDFASLLWNLKSLQQESQPPTQGDTIHDDDANQVNNIIADKIIHDTGPLKISVWAPKKIMHGEFCDSSFWSHQLGEGA